MLWGAVMADTPLDQLIKALARLPGLGPRSARRIALQLLTNKEKIMQPLMHALDHTASSVHTCSACGNLDTLDPCRICQSEKRVRNVICVVASVADLWAVERTSAYKGQYHILGGVLSALDGVGPQDLSIEGLLARIRTLPVDEIILALSATVDGQATAHYLSDRIQDVSEAKITRLAHGVPVGGELDYLDDGTITTALKARANV